MNANEISAFQYNIVSPNGNHPVIFPEIDTCIHYILVISYTCYARYMQVIICDDFTMITMCIF